MQTGTAPHYLWLGPLSIINWNGGSLEGRIRLQKAAYILKHLGVQPFASTRFVYHYYGPYSREFSDALHQAIVSGLVEEKQEVFETNATRYTYTLTQQGKDTLAQIQSDPKGAAVAQQILHQPWRVLELAATSLFLQKEEKIADRGRALDRALELKPECTEYRADSERLLQSLGA
jgi:uncharacterized protein YwgA